MSNEKLNTNYGEQGTAGKIPEQRDVPTSRIDENSTRQGQQIVSDTRAQIDAVIPGVLKK